MSFSVHKFREMVFQLLFSIDMGESVEGDLIPFLMRELQVSRKNVKTAYQKAIAIWEKKPILDDEIAKISKDYAFERIQRVERNVLRVAFYELKEEKELDAKIIIAEAIRLCRKFSTPEASSFVNAVLDEFAVSTRENETVK